ncbi:MAG: tetratricopeptide repeat protein [Lachnospiraceae bacterium]|nr:tetratricopeptide repeat protein [Lachnospiraceae bacterium]
MRRKLFTLLIILLTAAALTACGKDKMTVDGENDKGLGYYNAGDYETAREYFERALKIEPGNREVLNNYGMTLIQLRENDLAIEQFDAVIREDATNQKALKLNKFAYRGRGIAYMQKLEFQKALDSFVAALAISVDSGWNIDILYYKANAQECLGETDTAISTYGMVLELDKNNTLALRSRANLYREKKDYERAIADYEAALAKDEGNYYAYIGLYTCYREQGEEEKAEKALERASRLKIENNEDKYLLGQVHFYQGNYTSAKIEMTNAVENGFAEANYFLAEIAMAEKDYGKAIEYYDIYRESIITTSPTVCNQEAVCYLALFNYDKAQEMITLGLSFGASSARQQLMRNQIAVYEGRYDFMSAYTAFQTYIVEYPFDEEAIEEYKFVKKRLGYD